MSASGSSVNKIEILNQSITLVRQFIPHQKNYMGVEAKIRAVVINVARYLY